MLRDLCEMFHRMMLTHFPNKIVPKVHFVCEYEKIIHDYGPSLKQWCFRYEASHAYFKKLIMRTKQFSKNVAKTLATRHRLKQCFKFANSSRLKSLFYPVSIKKIQRTSFSMPMINVLLKHFGHIDLDVDLNQCNKLIYDNITYCQSAVYVIDLNSFNEQPIFRSSCFHY